MIDRLNMIKILVGCDLVFFFFCLLRLFLTTYFFLWYKIIKIN
jgi:hypothetical protein